MKTPLAVPPILCLLAALLTTPVGAESPVPAPQVNPTGSTAIPLDQLGAAAQKQYSGDGIGITPTANGARLKADATPEGLWQWASEGNDEDSIALAQRNLMIRNRGIRPYPSRQTDSAAADTVAQLASSLLRAARPAICSIFGAIRPPAWGSPRR